MKIEIWPHLTSRIKNFSIFVILSVVIITINMYRYIYICSVVEKKIFKEIMHFRYTTEIMKSITIYSVCLIYAQEWIFKELYQFSLHFSKLYPFGMEGGS